MSEKNALNSLLFWLSTVLLLGDLEMKERHLAHLVLL